MGTIFTKSGDTIKSVLSAIGEGIKNHSRVLFLVGGAVLLIFVLIFFLTLNSGGSKNPMENDAASGDSSLGASFSETIFLPYEPDFVPDVLLEREPRDQWTEEDALPFWTDPMRDNEQAWRKRIESGVDAILENVP